MKNKNLIAVETLCSHYNIEFTFIDALYNIGLVHIEVIEQVHFIPQEQINDLEKMIRLHHDLHVNPEGIDVVLNLLEKERALRKELVALKNKLDFYEKS